MLCGSISRYPGSCQLGSGCTVEGFRAHEIGSKDAEVGGHRIFWPEVNEKGVAKPKGEYCLSHKKWGNCCNGSLHNEEDSYRGHLTNEASRIERADQIRNCRDFL